MGVSNLTKGDEWENLTRRTREDQMMRLIRVCAIIKIIGDRSSLRRDSLRLQVSPYDGREQKDAREEASSSLAIASPPRSRPGRLGSAPARASGIRDSGVKCQF
ncbi:unnamed protein product [Lasius platythorax]|uniref:Uncharacterized protein n=1 Tax=Lasius platythorax TaxID=488582 RepID=A0AAV2NKV8_9HYME